MRMRFHRIPGGRKRRLPRWCILVVVGITLFIALTACQKQEETGVTTIRFVTWKPNIPAAQDALIDLFHQRNPDIRVEREVGPHSSTAFHDLLTQKLKNRSRDVDVFFMDVIWPPEFAAAGWAEPLDDRFPPEDRRAFLDGTILANTYQGSLYGVPLFIDSGVLFYRRDLLQKYGFEPPATWEQLVETAETIVAKEAGAGNKMFGFSAQFKQYEGLVCDMLEYILSNGGRVLGDDGRSALAEPAALDAVRFVRERIIGKVAPAGVLTYQEPESLDVFIQGRAVFHRNWPYAWEVSNDPARSAVAGRVGISRLPHFPGGRSHAALGGWQLGISRFSEHKDEAWRFVAFMTGPEAQKLLALRAGRAPTRKALYEDREVIEANPHFADLEDVFLTAHPRPRTPLYPAVSNVLQRYFSTVLSDPGADVKEQAAEASREIDKLLSLAR
jgi:multiple sugar transport system substrate-binding protein